MEFDIEDWYWRQAGGGDIFSSKALDIVPSSDPGYVAWVAEHLAATEWPLDGNGDATVDALKEVFARHGLRPTPPGSLVEQVCIRDLREAGARAAENLLNFTATDTGIVHAGMAQELIRQSQAYLDVSVGATPLLSDYPLLQEATLTPQGAGVPVDVVAATIVAQSLGRYAGYAHIQMQVWAGIGAIKAATTDDDKRAAMADHIYFN